MLEHFDLDRREPGRLTTVETRSDDPVGRSLVEDEGLSLEKPFSAIVIAVVP
jgi:hypothetical protein